jgi:hypothetical protein
MWGRHQYLIDFPLLMKTWNLKTWKLDWYLYLNWKCLSVVNTSRSFPRSRLITGFVTRLTRRVSLVDQERLTLPEHLSSPPVLSGVPVTRSLVLYVCFVDRCLSFCTCSFWPLCCLFFDIQILITPLVSSHSS